MSIRAVIEADFNENHATFDAEPWFMAVNPSVIMSLASKGWRACEIADEVAYFVADHVQGDDAVEVQSVLDYCQEYDVGFEVHVDRLDALRWLTINYPLIARLIEKKGW